MSIKHGLVVSFAAVALVACGNKGGSEAKDGAPVAAAAPTGTDSVSVYIRHLNEISEAVEKTHDEASARAAAGVIHASVAELDAWNKEVEKKSDAEKMALLMPHMAEFTQGSQRLAMAMMKLQTSDPKDLQIISEELDKMPNLSPQ